MSDSSENRFIADAGLGGISQVVATLPGGFNVGESRTVSNVRYRLCCNASANSVAVPGTFLTPVLGGGASPYSMTISSVSQTFANMGAALVVNTTVPTGNYFWGAVQGQVGGVIGDNTSVPTGSAFYISALGTVTLFPQSIITGNVAIGFNLGGAASKTVTTGAKSGDCIIYLE